MFYVEAKVLSKTNLKEIAIVGVAEKCANIQMTLTKLNFKSKYAAVAFPFDPSKVNII